MTECRMREGVSEQAECEQSQPALVNTVISYG